MGNKKIKHKNKNNKKKNRNDWKLPNCPIIHNRHAQKWHKKFIKNESNKNIYRTPEDLSIITVHNYKEKPLFERNMDHLGIEYESLNIDVNEYYSVAKIEYLYPYLKKNRKPEDIILVADADDVIFIDDPQKTLDVFYSYDCRVLFMSTGFYYPYHCMPQKKKWADKTNGGKKRYLNGGVYIGYVKDILKLYERVYDFIPKNKKKMPSIKEYRKIKNNPKRDLKNEFPDFPYAISSDQVLFRYVEPEFYPDLKVDYKNKLAYRNGNKP